MSAHGTSMDFVSTEKCAGNFMRKKSVLRKNVRFQIVPSDTQKYANSTVNIEGVSLTHEPTST